MAGTIKTNSPQHAGHLKHLELEKAADKTAEKEAKAESKKDEGKKETK